LGVCLGNTIAHKQKIINWMLLVGLEGCGKCKIIHWKIVISNLIKEPLGVKSSPKEESNNSMKIEDTRMFEHWGKMLKSSCSIFAILTIKLVCCNPSLGLVTKARACKVAGQERKLGNERKCEGMNLHTPKGASTLGVGVRMDSQMFRKKIQGSKLNGLKSYL